MNTGKNITEKETTRIKVPRAMVVVMETAMERENAGKFGMPSGDLHRD
jgi:hypothetical protein